MTKATKTQLLDWWKDSGNIPAPGMAHYIKYTKDKMIPERLYHGSFVESVVWAHDDVFEGADSESAPPLIVISIDNMPAVYSHTARHYIFNNDVYGWITSHAYVNAKVSDIKEVASRIESDLKIKPERHFESNPNYIAGQNGILDFSKYCEAVAAGDKHPVKTALIQDQPWKYFCKFNLSAEWKDRDEIDQDSVELVDRFFSSSMGNDPQKIDQVQMAIGSILYVKPSNNNVATFHFSPGESGKSLARDIVQQLFKDGGFTKLDLDDFGDTHAPINLTDSVINWHDDVSDAMIDSKSFSVLKSCITGGSFYINRKYLNGTDVFPYGKYHFNCNSLPKLSVNNTGHAADRRCLFIKWPVTFDDNNPDTDPELKDKLMTKDGADALLLWMLEGCRKWKENKFTIPETLDSLELRAEFEQMNSTFVQFVNEKGITANCFVHPEQYLMMWSPALGGHLEPYELYENFCQEFRIGKPLQRRTFNKECQKLFKDIKLSKERKTIRKGKQVTLWAYKDGFDESTIDWSKEPQRVMDPYKSPLTVVQELEAQAEEEAEKLNKRLMDRVREINYKEEHIDDYIDCLKSNIDRLQREPDYSDADVKYLGKDPQTGIDSFEVHSTNVYGNDSWKTPGTKIIRNRDTVGQAFKVVGNGVWDMAQPEDLIGR